MFLTNTIIVLAVIAVCPNCLAKLLGLKPYLNREYELVSSDENFHEVLQILDIGSARRPHYINAKTTLTLTWNRKYDLYNLLVRSPLILHEDIFMIGEPYDFTTVDGREVSALFTLEGNTLIHTQQQPGKPVFVISWTFSLDHVIVKSQIQDIISYRVYNAVTE